MPAGAVAEVFDDEVTRGSSVVALWVGELVLSTTIIYG